MGLREDLFGGSADYNHGAVERKSDAEYGSLVEDFKGKVLQAHEEAPGNFMVTEPGTDGIRVLRKGAAMVRRTQASLTKLETIEKGLSADQAVALSGDIALMRADLETINKDWTPTSPVGGTGLTQYDLEGPAKVLVPLTTPFRNSTPRIQGHGSARKFKRIDSFSNAGVPGGAATLSPFFNSLTATSTWGPTNNITLARPQKIAYTGSDWSIPYVELGLSDSVDYITQFQGIGFDDVRALSHTALLYAHMMGEERAMLYGRGTQTGYSGVVAAPTVAVAGSNSGGGLATNTYFVYVTTVTGFGESLPSTVQNSGALTGPSGSAVITVTPATGSIGVYNLYVGTTTGIANAHFQGQFTGNTNTLIAYNAAGAVAANVDTSANAASYDGWLTIQSNPTLTGYFLQNNAKFSTTNPGSEFDLALQTMFVNNGATPDEIWMTGAMRAEFGQLMRIGGSNGASSGYRTNVVSGDGSVTMGTSVTGYVNQNNGDVLSINTHRFMPNGNALIRSTSLPIQNSHVAAPVTAVNVQDYMAIDWPQIQLTYDASTYQIGTLVFEAPAWSGLISGIL